MSSPLVGPEGLVPPKPGERREVFGWLMYQWAFHGFETTVATVLFGPYLTELAQQAVGENGRVFAFDFLGSVAVKSLFCLDLLSAVTAKSFFFFCVSLSVLLQALLLPVLGAIADYSHSKKRLLVLTGCCGAGSTCLLFFVGAGLDFRWGGLLFIVANLSLGATTVLYNAFLPEIVPPGQRDRISSRGYALGYHGGGLLLAANLVFMHFAQDLGVPGALAWRLSLLSAGLWWVGFSFITFRRLKTRGASKARPKGRSYLAVGLSELRGTFRELARLPRTRSYLIAYLFFNDGIQTIISVASVFFAQELFVARGREVDKAFLVGVMLMVQFVGFAGSLIFERIAILTGAKNALLFSLAIWSGVVVYAYWVFQTEAQAWGMAAIIAVVLGGSQALSRSLFSCMIPSHREASFFGIYEIANSGTSWMGPLLFGLVVSVTNSYRQAVLSLIVLFAVGFLLLVFTDTDRAIREAGQA
jgi:UMF1 family MFS transporter